MRRFMTVAWMLTAATCFAQQIDLKSLDKLAAKATEKTEINMDEAMLKSASGFLDEKKADEGLAKKASRDLKGITLRSYEFDKKGAYKLDDLKSLMNQLKAPDWKLFLKSEEEGELTQIWMHYTKGVGDGMLLISAEEEELTVINAVGSTNLADFGALGALGSLSNLSVLGNTAKAPEKNNAPKNDN